MGIRHNNVRDLQNVSPSDILLASSELTPTVTSVRERHVHAINEFKLIHLKCTVEHLVFN